MIHQKVAPKVQKLLKTTTEGNRGVVIKPWVWDHHAFYNLKDYYSYKHHQDADLVIDYQNSDLMFPTEYIEMTTFHNAHEDQTPTGSTQHQSLFWQTKPDHS
jgi:hypothetical protein